MTGTCLDRTVALLGRLIAFDTTSRNSNLALIDFLQGHLAELGVKSRLSFDDSGEKANLLATIGPPGRPGIVLSGHSDVVPVDGQDWRFDPFVARTEGGRVFGRGACDMKGFVAAMVAMVPSMRAAPLARPFHLAVSYDEEVGCKGVPRLLDQMAEILPERPMGCVVGEPTGMRVVDGHKGKAAWSCTVTGRACHSSLTHQGVNAVVHAARIVGMLDDLARNLAQDGPFADGFVPPHDTISIGRIEGGTSLNTVPDRCRFEFEVRTLPGHDARELVAPLLRRVEADILPAMQAVAPEAGIDFEEILAYPGLGGGAGAFGELCCRLTGTLRPQKVPFGTEAGHFASRGIPSVVCGPGDVAVAHRPDEHVEIAQLQACLDFLARLIDHARA